MTTVSNRGIAGLVTGLIFGLGLSVSQMANPEKVLAFLNLPGNWDPSLLVVMAAAVGVSFAGFRFVRQPLFDTELHLPGNRAIDPRLIAGAVIFGIGWGLAGYCPGPAITALSTGALEPVIFVAAMIGGSQVARLV